MTLRLTTRWSAIFALALLGLLGAIQFVPYGRSCTNPPVVAEPAWDSPDTRAIAQRACFDCHSNETRWPAYARVAPASWLISYDVSEGRRIVNFSEWQRSQEEAAEAAEAILEQEMPPRPYLLMHPKARLTAPERERLAAGLTKTVRIRAETSGQP